MPLSDQQLADVYVAACDGATKAQVKTIASAFVEELAARGWTHRWRNVARAIDASWKKRYGAANVVVVSAHPLSSSMRKSLEEAAPGADIIERVDERLMGGAVVRIDDRRIDASVAGALQRLKTCLEKTA